MGQMSQEQLEQLRDRHEAWLMAQPGVLGTGIGLGPSEDLVLRIFTKGISEQTRRAIAARLRDVPIDWEEGEIVPLAETAGPST